MKIHALGTIVFSFAMTFAATSNAGLSDCGQPKSSGTKPVTADALYTLQAAVKTVSCDLCVCDVNLDLKLAASDALLTLKKAVGQDVALDCPGCIGTLVFVSSATYQGDLGGLTGADERCEQLASAAGFEGRFAAWLSDSHEDVRSRIGCTSGPFTRLDGSTVANSFADLVDGAVDVAIDRTEKGEVVSASSWTGTDPSGTACFDGYFGGCDSFAPMDDLTSCSDWNGTDGQAVTGIGSAGGSWTRDATRYCDSQQRLLCIELSACSSADDCAETGNPCIERACALDGYCRGVLAAAGTPCAEDGSPLKDVCGDPESSARGFCVECNEDSECTDIPEGAFAAGCLDHACVGVEHGSQVFDYTGTAQSFDVPPSVTSITITAKGAQGGNLGGLGGSVRATLAVSPHQRLSVFVGENGGTRLDAGFNGGGRGGFSGGGEQHWGGGGGGASDVRASGDDLEDRIIVAGGGGGAWAQGQEGSGGAGGGLSGGAGGGGPGHGGGGATQDAGGVGGGDNVSCLGEAGSLGKGGAGSQWGDQSVCATYGGGGGGGGYYGGGGAGARGGDGVPIFVAGGGGGSSWVVPDATDVTHQTGVREGNGEVTIEW